MINWVIGSRGLLGSAVSDELHKFGDTWQPSSHIIWAENGDSEQPRDGDVSTGEQDSDEDADRDSECASSKCRARRRATFH